MKKKIAAAILILLILFFPIPWGRYKDGGSRDFRALTYTLVVWNKLVSEEDGSGGFREDVYHKTSIYWFPRNFNGLDRLWEIECQRNR